MRSGRFLAVATSLALLGYFVLLSTLPRIVPIEVSPDIVSAASALGYNAPLTYTTALIWSLAIIAFGAVFRWRIAPQGPAQPGAGCGRIVLWELLVVAGVFFLLYCPWILARDGPHMEDQTHILALFRMACGQMPYQDFEFLYGPSMAYSVWSWAAVFGVSMTSYFGFVATQEALQFALLVAVLQIIIPNRGHRILVFLLLLPFLANTLLGVNWSAARRLVPVLAIVLAAARPFDLRVNLFVGAVIGLHASYSHEYAAAALLGIGAIYAVLLLGPNWRSALRSGPIVAIVAVAFWAATVTLWIGTDWSHYIAAMQRVVSVMTQGHVSFAFYWSLNSLALFALLALACLLAGAALPGFRKGASTGDLLLVGGVVFALITLKSGLNRADHWHVAAAFLGLFMAFLLPLPSSAVRLTMQVRRVATVLIAVAAFGYLFGIYATARNYASNYVKGARDVLSGIPVTDIDPATFRDYSTETDRTRPDPALTAIGAYLADPSRRDRPVLYYGGASTVASRVGACPGDYKNDALMYSGFDKTERGFLEANPDSFVVMSRADYERVFEGRKETGGPLSVMSTLAGWLATPHYLQGRLEAQLLNAARDSVSADFLRDRYQAVDWPTPFGLEVLLEHKP